MIRAKVVHPRPACNLEGPDERHHPTPEPSARPANRWAVLALLGVAQLMVVLDATIVNIALPSAQRALHFSTDNRQWVVTAYALAFGSLLLLGGKLGDLFGRKWTLIGGLIGFAVASAIGGLAQSFGMLVAARALQGAFGAILAPSALGLLTVTFRDLQTGPRRSGSSARSRPEERRSVCCSAACSPRRSRGAGASTSTSRSRCPTAIVALRLLRNERQPEPRADRPARASRSPRAACSPSSTASRTPRRRSWSDPVTIIALGLPAPCC